MPGFPIPEQDMDADKLITPIPKQEDSASNNTGHDGGLSNVETPIHTGGNQIVETDWRDNVLTADNSNSNGEKTKIPKPGVSGKEGAKDVLSWARGNKPFVGESGKEFAERLLDAKHGKGTYPTGAKSEFNQIKKWGDRSFVDPK